MSIQSSFSLTCLQGTDPIHATRRKGKSLFLDRNKDLVPL